MFLHTFSQSHHIHPNIMLPQVRPVFLGSKEDEAPLKGLASGHGDAPTECLGC